MPNADPLLPVPGGDLLRRFLPALGSPAIPAAAFRPTPADATPGLPVGISVSFADLPNPIARVLADTRRPAGDYSVCQFDVAGLDGLTVLPSPTEKDPGHATIPEIAPPYDKLKDSDERKIRLKTWQAELARRAKVVHTATGVAGT